MRVAAVQMSSQDDLSANLAEARHRIEEARALGATLVVLPENFAYFGPEEGRRRIAEDVEAAEGPILRALSEAARELGVTVVGGGMPERSPDPERPFNTCVVVGPDGAVSARYRKIHLFDVDLADGTSLRESASTMPGDAPVVAGVGARRVGLSICYDLRFPELYRALVSEGADVLVVPAAFTVHTGKDHWHVLLRARAIESQAWVIAAAQWGKHPRGRTTYGHALVVDPWGTVVAEASDRPGVVVAELDAKHQHDIRAALPSLKHRRL
ncbi:MAG TPA: carbon-nitrogen hydrolase family protein [Polyangiaceae bacterium]|nr:carbon-nitrogen hydrolase family protein [Polyangiaceae bacterium]